MFIVCLWFIRLIDGNICQYIQYNDKKNYALRIYSIIIINEGAYAVFTDISGLVIHCMAGLPQIVT